MDKMKKFDDKFDEIADGFKEAKTEEEKEQLRREFWTNAVECFDELIGGEVTLADGRKITIPTIHPKEGL